MKFKLTVNGLSSTEQKVIGWMTLYMIRAGHIDLFSNP